MQLIKLTLETNSESAEHLADLLTALDAEAVSLIDAGGEELFQLQPEHSPLWKKTKVEAIYSADINPEILIEQLENLAGEKLKYSVEELIEQDWVRITQAAFKPIHFENYLSIYPSWHEFENLAETQLCIDPGLAFGTGTHPTTQLCLDYLAHNKPTGQTVVDYGCGSGILALSASALGAKTVFAVDHDPQALLATQQNAELNHFSVLTFLPEALPELKADLVIANILAVPLLELHETLLKLLKTGANLLLSGLLDTETNLLLECYQPHFKEAKIKTQEGWARILFSFKTNI